METYIAAAHIDQGRQALDVQGESGGLQVFNPGLQGAESRIEAAAVHRLAATRHLLVPMHWPETNALQIRPVHNERRGSFTEVLTNPHAKVSQTFILLLSPALLMRGFLRSRTLRKLLASAVLDASVYDHMVTHSPCCDW